MEKEARKASILWQASPVLNTNLQRITTEINPSSPQKNRHLLTKLNSKKVINEPANLTVSATCLICATVNRF